MMNTENKPRFTRRDVLGAIGGLAIAAPFRISLAQTVPLKPGQPLPPLLMETYPDQGTVEASRIYARELAKLGIRTNLRPLAFTQILGKVYGRKDVVTALTGYGASGDRVDPDFYLRAIYGTGGNFNSSHYSNPKYDRLMQAQLRETDAQARLKLIFEAQEILAEDMPSWHVCSLSAVNPVNKKLFRNFKPTRAWGMDVFHPAPYMELEPASDVREVNVATTYLLQTFHPFSERGTNGRGLLKFVFDTFMHYDNDLKLVPGAAESYRIVSPTVYELKLRPNMKWHDGKSVTIEDAKFTFDYALKWKPPIWDSFLTPIRSAHIVDERTLRVELNAPTVTFLTVSLPQLMLLPKHIWQNVEGKPWDWDALNNGGMVGSGPFRFARFQKDVDCHLRANHEYWGGSPKIDGLHYIQAAGVEQLVGGMESNNIHIIAYGVSLTDAKRLAKRDGIEVLITDCANMTSFILDVRKPPLNDKAFRMAMYYALPKKNIIDIVLGGAGKVARRSPIPPVFTELIPENLPGDEYDPNKAKDILAKSGYTWSKGLLVMK